jgi:hypothetical protein
MTPPPDPAPRSRQKLSLPALLLLGGLVLLGVVAVIYAVLHVGGPGSEHMGFHGWFALALGAGVSIALSVGLFAVTFHSSRSGHDTRADGT